MWVGRIESLRTSERADRQIGGKTQRNRRGRSRGHKGVAAAREKAARRAKRRQEEMLASARCLKRSGQFRTTQNLQQSVDGSCFGFALPTWLRVSAKLQASSLRVTLSCALSFVQKSSLCLPHLVSGLCFAFMCVLARPYAEQSINQSIKKRLT